MEELTPKQERFCQEYIVDYNGTQAAIRTGYSGKSAGSQAGRLLKNAKVLARVRQLQAEQVQRLSVSQDWVVLQLRETLRKCLEPQPVMQWVDGKLLPCGEYAFDSKGALKALELLGKHLGMFTDKLSLSGSVNTGRLDRILEQLYD